MEHEFLAGLVGKRIARVTQSRWNSARVEFTDGSFLDITARETPTSGAFVRLDPSEEPPPRLELRRSLLRVLNHFKFHPAHTVTQAAASLSLRRETVNNYLMELKDAGVIRREWVVQP